MHPTADYTCKHSAAWRTAVAGMASSYRRVRSKAPLLWEPSFWAMRNIKPTQVLPEYHNRA